MTSSQVKVSNNSKKKSNFSSSKILISFEWFLSYFFSILVDFLDRLFYFLCFINFFVNFWENCRIIRSPLIIVRFHFETVNKLIVTNIFLNKFLDQIKCPSLQRKKLCRLISSYAVRLDSCNKNWRSSDKNAENINLSERHSKTPTQTGNAGDSLVCNF